ncbi:MAG: ribose-phosphate diphosphokinase [Candidatus Kaiserbacteria bacterium]|nr:MAG: ribose-phosphate diphosphokinase [Candidatus Kaiserbacteria bacterium]
MDFRVFSLGSNDGLAKKIADYIGRPLGEIKLKTFADGEQYVQFLENLRGKHVFLVQSGNPPAENWVRLFLAIDAARGASASEITAVVPYFGYARQDRKSKPREPISARVFANILERLGAARFLTMDLHTDALVGFFRGAIVDNLLARRVFIPFVRERFADAIASDDLVVVSPDVGGVVRAQSYAKRLTKSADLAVINKEREIPNRIAKMNLIGDVKGKIALIVDDIVDTCGTLATAAKLLEESGAREVYAVATHGLLSGDASKTLDASPIKKVFITDTISPDRTLSSKVEIVSVGEVFGEAIQRIEAGESLSELFETE